MLNYSNQRGVTIIELMTVLFIISICTASALSNLDEINRPLTNATFEVTHFLRLARSRAVSQTKYVKVTPISNYGIYTYSGDTCDIATTRISDLTLFLPTESSLVANNWTVCYSPRGLVDTNVSFGLSDEKGNNKTIEIALGGGVRVQ